MNPDTIPTMRSLLRLRFLRLAGPLLFLLSWAGPDTSRAADIPAASPVSLAPEFQPRPIRLPPLFWHEKDIRERQRLLMVLMLYWDYQEEASSHKLLLPVFYRWKEEDRSLIVSLPLYLSYKSPDDYWTLAGPFYRHDDPQRKRTALFPLYWSTKKSNGGRMTVALPFVFYDYSNPLENRRDFVSPFGWFRQRPSTSTGFLLNYWWKTESSSRFRTLFPVYWHLWSPGDRLDVWGLFYRRETDDKKWAGLFPLAGAGWGRGLASHYLFPVYYYSHDEDETAFATLLASRIRSPDSTKGHLGLYYYSVNPDERIHGLFPIWHHSRSSDDYSRRTWFLLYYSRKENDSRFHTLFPFYGYWESPEKKRFLSWLYLRTEQEDTVSGWAGLYRWKKEGADETNVFFPLYWHFWRDPDWGLDVFFPLYLRWRDADSSLTAIPPFLWRKKGSRTTWSLFFLLWRDRDADRGFTTMFPLFHSMYDPQRSQFFSPIAWRRKSRLSREGIVPPVYWYRSAEIKRLFVIPVYWSVQHPEKRLLIVPPYYSWKDFDSRIYGLFPLWGHHREQDRHGGYLFPFYWYSKKTTGDGVWIIPPLLTYIQKDRSGTPDSALHVQYLILGDYSRKREDLEHGFFPLYKYVSSPERTNFWAPRILALTAWDRRGESRQGYFFPYAWKRAPDRRWDFLFPLWYRHDETRLEDNTTSRLRIFFPLYWSGTNTRREWRYFVPLYARFSSAHGNRFRAVTPLYMSYQNDRGNRFRMIFPLYWRFASAKRDISIYGPWYRTTGLKNGRTTRTVGLAPFFSKSSAGPDDNYFELLGGLFARDVQEGQRRFRFLYFFYTKPKPLGDPARSAPPSAD